MERCGGEVLSVAHHNIRSLRDKSEELEAFVLDAMPDLDVLCLTEHWLCDYESNFRYLSDFMVADCFTRTGLSRGGSLIMVRDSVAFEPLNFKSFSLELHCEISAVKLAHSSVFVICIYRSPNGDFAQFLLVLERLLNCLIDKNRVLICGDFNVHFNVDNSRRTSLLDLFTVYGFIQTVTAATRLENCLDNIFVNFAYDHFSVDDFDPLLSDHSLQYIRILMDSNSSKSGREFKVCRPITAKGKFDFYNIISDTDFSFLNDKTSCLNTRVSDFMSVLNGAYLRAFPERTLFTKVGRRVKWFTAELGHMREHLHFLGDLYKHTDLHEFKQARDVFRRKYKRALKLARVEANNEFILGSSCRGRSVWQVIDSLHAGDNSDSDPVIAADAFNQFFVDVPREVARGLPVSDMDPMGCLSAERSLDNFTFSQISPVTTREIVDSLKSNNSRDYYGLNVSLVKSIKNLIIGPLTLVINECIAESVFPDAWKIASVVPVFKKGDKENMSNYRPISLLPAVSKIFERALKLQIASYLDNNDILTDCQYGFRRGRCTTDAILNFVSVTLGSFEKGLYSGAVFCDLSKAFDCVSHSLLIKKLKFYGFSDSSSNLLQSYLTNRRQQVRLKNNRSSFLKTSAGVPQGSILGPVLFLIFINDLPNALQGIHTVLFADDTTLLVSGESINTVLNACEGAQSRARKWFAANKLCLNESKTVVMLSSTRDLSPCEDNVNGNKFLGVTLDPGQRWDLHGDMLAGRLASCAYALRRLSRSVSEHVLRVAYFGLFHSRLSYAILTWGHSASRHRLFALQRRAVRIVSGAGYRDDCRGLFVAQRILTYPSMFALESLCYTRKNVHNHSRRGAAHNYDTRNREDLSVEFLRLTRSRTGVSFDGIKLFNLLPTVLKLLPLADFRHELKAYFLRGAFFSLQEIYSDLESGNIGSG